MRWQQCKPGIAFHVALPNLASPVVTAPAWKRMRQNLSRGKGIQCKLRSWFEANTWEGKHVKVPCMWIKREGKQLKNDQEDSCMAIEEAASLIAQVSS